MEIDNLPFETTVEIVVCSNWFAINMTLNLRNVVFLALSCLQLSELHGHINCITIFILNDHSIADRCSCCHFIAK